MTCTVPIISPSLSSYQDVGDSDSDSHSAYRKSGGGCSQKRGV